MRIVEMMAGGARALAQNAARVVLWKELRFLREERGDLKLAFKNLLGRLEDQSAMKRSIEALQLRAANAEKMRDNAVADGRRLHHQLLEVTRAIVKTEVAGLVPDEPDPRIVAALEVIGAEMVTAVAFEMAGVAVEDRS